MRKNSQKYSIPFFRSMLFRYLAPSLVILFACVIFFAVLFGMVAKNADEEFAENQREKLIQRMADVETTVLRIDYAQKELINSDSFSQLAFMYDDLDWFTRYSLQNDMQKELRNMCSNNDLVKSAYLIIPPINKVISDKKVNATVPDAVIEAVNSGQHTIAAYDGSVLVISYRTDTDGSISAAFAVVLDENEIVRQLGFALSGSSDSIILHIKQNEDDSSADKKSVVVSSLLPIEAEYSAAKSTPNKIMNRMLLISIFFVLIVFVIEIIGMILWYKHTYKPLYTLLIEAFGKAEDGDYSYRISAEKGSPWESVFASFNHMMEKTERYVETNLKQQILVSRANLKQLQSQISPHFMYNSYYVLYRLIKKGDQEGSLKLAEQLGQFYQYVTRNADDEKHLEEEVAHAKNYAAIQKFRFRNAIEMQIDDPDERIAKVYVPRLILQPLLENVFKYAYDAGNAALNDEGVIRLRIRYDVESSDDFDIIVENSGDITDEKIREICDKLASTDDTLETTALVNIHRRLKIYFGPESGLDVERSPLGGLMVRMKIRRNND